MLNKRLAMKRLTNLLAILAVLSLASCTPSPAASNEGNTDVAEDVYFVKYASNGLQGSYNVSYTAEDGKSVGLSNIKGEDFERTIGPVSKGFKASYSVMTSLNYTTVATRIEVKKGSEPFVVKQESVRTFSGSAGSCGVSYTIE